MEANLRGTSAALLVAILPTATATAQQAYPPLFHQVPAPRLQCDSFTAQDAQGRYGDAVEVQVSRANSRPPMPTDFKVIGGKCDFQAHDAVPDMVRINWQKSLPDGFSCKAGPAGATSFVTTTATAYACRIVDPPIDAKPIDARPTAIRPPGDVAVIARRGTAFKKPLIHDYRVCNVDAASGVNVGWYDQTMDATNAGASHKNVPAGSCMELGAATYIQFQAGNPGDPTLQVYYNRYPRNSFAPGVRIVSAPNNEPPLPPPGEPIPGAEPKRAECDRPKPSRTCRAPLPAWGSYRICFSEKLVERADDPSNHNWPTKYLKMIVDGKLVSAPIGVDPARWNAVFPNTCRDYYQVAAVHVIVTDENGYPAKNVSAVHMTVAPLK